MPYYNHKQVFDMQKIQKFQFGCIYSAPKASRTYELTFRDGHHLTFRAKNLKTRDSWEQQAVSTYKADSNGAFEEVFFSDGTRLRSDAARKEPEKARGGTAIAV